MGFYGDFYDRRQVAFQFDRIFNNRKSMDTLAAAGQDGVFSGRFVLVRYDPQSRFFEGDIQLGYLFNDIMYMDYQYTVPYTYTTYSKVASPVKRDWASYYYYTGSYYFKLPNEQYFDENETEYYIADNPSLACIGLNQIVRLFHEDFGPIQTYYKCIGSENNISGEIAKWEPIYYDNMDSDYLRNYNIDKATYGIHFDIRGYDSTIWEKVYTEGKGAFVLISHLNGLTPALELYPDPPRQLPAAPYIDNLSSDVYYRIHVPSMYGLQLKEVKESDSFISDQRETVLRYRYNNTNHAYDEYSTEIDAGIYLNLKGNNYQKRSVDNTTPNYVRIEPTGESGRVYYDANGNEQRKDIMEMSFSLPAIGNMLASGYDLMYGVVTNNTNRKTDVAWINGNQPDDVKHNETTKSYDKNSLAGVVNTAHDILGQIIVPLAEKPSQQQIEQQLSEDLIYQIGDTYYRKGIAYDQEIIDLNSKYYDVQEGIEKPMLQFVDIGIIPKSDFIGNKYFILNSENQYVEAKEWNENTHYWVKSIVGARYTPIELTQFIQGQFYYQNGENYICDQSINFPLYPERTYYELTIAEDFPKRLEREYNTTDFWLKLDDGSYEHPLESFPELGKTYYYINQYDASLIEDINNVRFYVPGFYYYFDETTNQWEKATSRFLDKTKLYAIIVYKPTESIGYDEQGKPYLYRGIQNFIGPLDPNNAYQIQNCIGDMSDYYYIKNDNYYTFNSLKNIPESYGVQHPITMLRNWKRFITDPTIEYNDSNLYIKNKYYIQDETGSYIKSNGPFSRGTQYYKFSAIEPVKHPFYLMDTYFYQIPGTWDQFDISHTNTMTESTYYTKAHLYVYSDSLRQCPYGYEWSDYVNFIPPSITLYYKKSRIDLIPIQGLVNGKNSIYGQALALHKMFGLNDEETRDTSEIRGAFNALQDILYLIKTIKPGHLLFVNDMGQIEATDDAITIDKLKALLH